MRYALLIMVILIASPAAAGEDWFSWDRNNTYLQIPLTLAMAVDLGQTLDAVKNPDKYYEMNNILRDHPEQHEIYQYFIASYITKTAVTYILPPKWSHFFQGVMLTISVSNIEYNAAVGLHVNF